MLATFVTYGQIAARFTQLSQRLLLTYQSDFSKKTTARSKYPALENPVNKDLCALYDLDVNLGMSIVSIWTGSLGCEGRTSL